MAGERARRKYKDLRLDLSIRKREHEIATTKGHPVEEGYEETFAADSDKLASFRSLPRDRLRAREQKMLKGHLPRVIYHPVC